MIVTIDGPAGAGKSTIAKQLAKRLGFHFLDTGAMYRAVVFVALQQGVSLSDETALASFASTLAIDSLDGTTTVDDRDVSNAIRTNQVTTNIVYAADNQRVRQILTERQRELAIGKDIVTEGRDQGTVVFPNADCKFFLTASAEERARRRWLELNGRGEPVDFAELLLQQEQRDQQDYNRSFGALRKASDAIEVRTDGMTPEEVLNKLAETVSSCRCSRYS